MLLSGDPREIGKYELLERLGKGGFGIVYKARHKFLKRIVAIKTTYIDDPEVKKNFFREAEIAGKLQHRNITLVHDFGIEGNLAYLVQEFLEGRDLREIIEEREPMEMAKKVDILLQVAQGLAYAHRKGVIHRDVKPGNIRILNSGLVKILDFGIAQLAEEEVRRTQKGGAVGTVSYISPEFIEKGISSKKGDIFAFGVVAYEFLTYTRPFEGKDPLDVIQKIVNVDPIPINKFLPSAPSLLVSTIKKCLHKNPDKRPASFDEIASLLESILLDLDIPFIISEVEEDPDATLPVWSDSALSKDETKPIKELDTNIDNLVLESSIKYKDDNVEEDEKVNYSEEKTVLLANSSPEVSEEVEEVIDTEKEELEVISEESSSEIEGVEDEIFIDKPEEETEERKKFVYKPIVVVGGIVFIVALLVLGGFVLIRDKKGSHPKQIQVVKQQPAIGKKDNIIEKQQSESKSISNTIKIEKGSIVVKAVPWAVITRIVKSDNQNIEIPGDGIAPIKFELESGTYNIELSHPSSERLQICTVQVLPGETSECKVHFPVSSKEYLEVFGFESQ